MISDGESVDGSDGARYRSNSPIEASSEDPSRCCPDHARQLAAHGERYILHDGAPELLMHHCRYRLDPCNCDEFLPRKVKWMRSLLLPMALVSLMFLGCFSSENGLRRRWLSLTSGGSGRGGRCTSIPIPDTQSRWPLVHRYRTRSDAIDRRCVAADAAACWNAYRPGQRMAATELLSAVHCFCVTCLERP